MGEKKFLEQINAIVSHEMRNPLNAVLSMVEKIKERVKSLIKNLENDPAIPQKSAVRIFKDVKGI